MALRAAVENVSCPVPAVFGKGLFVELRLVPVTRENVWSFQEKLAGLVMFMSLGYRKNQERKKKRDIFTHLIVTQLLAVLIHNLGLHIWK